MKVIRKILQNNKVLGCLWIITSMFGYYCAYKGSIIGGISSAILMLIIVWCASINN